jgi:AbrB family looped-hinge helix DNA binding protein
MQNRVTISPRGVITIPSRMREAFGLKANDQLIIENTPEGLLLRPTVSIPIELYTDERIAEFTRDEDAVAKLLDRAAAAVKPRENLP